MEIIRFHDSYTVQLRIKYIFRISRKKKLIKKNPSANDMASHRFEFVEGASAYTPIEKDFCIHITAWQMAPTLYAQNTSLHYSHPPHSTFIRHRRGRNYNMPRTDCSHLRRIWRGSRLAGFTC